MISSTASQREVTELLADWSSGNQLALERLIPLVQPELHRLAHYYMGNERAGHTLQTTALVNEAYLHLVDQTQPHWKNRKHFVAVAAQVMRRIMVDHARKHHALKRGRGAIKVSLDETALVTQQRAAELVALDEALAKLATFDLRKAQIVEMRYFGGMNVAEIADVLGIHSNTVTRDWSAAKAWLYSELSSES